jgi:hypothetical protein
LIPDDPGKIQHAGSNRAGTIVAGLEDRHFYSNDNRELWGEVAYDRLIR